MEGFQCSQGPFLMLSELPLRLTYATSSQQPQAITPAGSPIKGMLSLQRNNCQSKANLWPTFAMPTARSLLSKLEEDVRFLLGTRPLT